MSESSNHNCELLKQELAKYLPSWGLPAPPNYEILIPKALLELIERVEELERRASS